MKRRSGKHTFRRVSIAWHCPDCRAPLHFQKQPDVVAADMVSMSLTCPECGYIMMGCVINQAVRDARWKGA